MNETPVEFYRKLDRVTEIAWWGYWRINYACAVQSRAFKNMPDIVDTCAGLVKQFTPERIRVVQLAPDQWGNQTSQLKSLAVDNLRTLDVEVVTIDARRSTRIAEPGNMQVLADYFDFS